ncbi:Early nodulin-like protein [Actinidia chinensis var. chinensis]|uniref:Early nodulin-like protein n=1 Tax=Actinidia chinensis var. chinensis TaxID=1590841 RepID=A0A2R6RJH9_ACTCC|nr:Early nodulin-like protein [Actinidia chinensis var. chinensis]
MASNSMVLFLLFISFSVLSVTSFEFQVGDTNGWVVPPSNDSKIYNDWASENRFQVGDTIHFKYKKDSVMEVTESDYKKCNSTHPNFFSNTGDTLFKLDRSGPFYFISGASGHCSRGQKMILKVMSDEDSQSGGGSRSSGSAAVAVMLCGGVVAPLAFSYMF